MLDAYFIHLHKGVNHCILFLIIYRQFHKCYGNGKGICECKESLRSAFCWQSSYSRLELSGDSKLVISVKVTGYIRAVIK